MPFFMIQNIFTYLLIAGITFFPIVVWAYIFSFIDENPINRKRFYLGLFWWIISVVPILYIDKIINFLKIKYLNTFYFITEIKDFLSWMEFIYSLTLFFWLIVICSFLFGFIFHLCKDIFKIYLKNIWVFLFFIFVLSFFIFILNFWLVWFDFQVSTEASANFWNIVFNSFKLLIFYYLF